MSMTKQQVLAKAIGLAAKRAWRPHNTAALLAGVSVLALLVHSTPAEAVCIGRCGAAGATGAATAAATAAIVSAQQAAQLTQQSMNSLTKATLAVQAMAAAQAAAHSLSLGASSSVPNGLALGGLVPDSGLASNGTANPVTTWIGANTPTETSNGNQTIVTIQQTQQKAILNWSSFNVGTNTEVYFNQSGGNSSTGNGWIALNRISDPSGVPSQILGQIKAEGSVYIINGNGIIFGGSSQINVSSLIASSLNLFSNNLATSNNRFLNGGIGDLNANNVATDSILLTSSSPGAGNITIESGATITLASQGLAVIAAPNVTNSGTIYAPSGQAALIAGIGVSYDYNYSSFSPNGPGGSAGQTQGYNDNSTTNLRFANYGQWTNAQGQDITPVGTLVNNGLIYTPRGNITLLGGAVQQNGVAVATTSVQQPGSIVVQSLYEVGANGAQNPADESDATFYTGSTSFGPQAVTAILPDSNGVTLASDATSLAPFKTAPGAASFNTPLPVQGLGLVEIIGRAIDFQGGTLVYAPGQTVSASTAVLVDPRATVPPVPGSGRILLEDGAVIDVSGIPDTMLPATYNLLTVSLGGNELADSPLQQNGFLYGQTVTVDMRLTGTNAETGESWVGTPLANLTSYLNLEQQSIDQLLVNGGAVYFQSNEFVGQPGSTINLMGGYIKYLGGIVNTTELIGSDGRIYNIGGANPNISYVGIAGQFTVDHARWQVSETYVNRLISGAYYESDYIQGGNAGTLNISVGNLAGGPSSNLALVADSGATILDSNLLAGTVAGARQVASGKLPTDGTFDFTGIEAIEIGEPSVLSPQSLQISSVGDNFSMGSPLLAMAGSPYAAANVFSSQTFGNGDFGAISLTTGSSSSPPLKSVDASITEDAGTSLVVQPGGSITLHAGNVIINGSLVARAGSISVTTKPVISSGFAGLYTDLFNNGYVPGDILIGSNAVLDVSGLLYNNASNPDASSLAAPLINGGSISLVTSVGVTHDTVPLDLTGNIVLATGSVLNLEGGGHVLANGTLQIDSNTGAPAGRGGNLTLETYQGINIPVIVGSAPTRGILSLDGTINALGFDGGGTLTLQAVALQIGGDAATAPSYAFYFDPTAWGNLGFASFDLSSALQSEVPAGAVVRLTHANLLPDLDTIMNAPTGADPAAYSTVGYLTGTLLSPTNLSITAGLEQSNNPNPTSGGSDYAQIDPDAQIIANPGAAISLASYAMITVFGGIWAPGGSITLTHDYAPGAQAGGPIGPIYLGPQSVLNVAGTAVINPLAALASTPNGLVRPYTGEILPGGTVTITNDYSAILVAPGAVIDVSGAAGAFDVAQLVPGPLHGTSEILVRQPVWSNAGTVSITGGTGLLFEGTLIGEPGAPQANGGTLQVSGIVNPQSGSDVAVIVVQDTAATATAAGASFDFATYVPQAGAFTSTFTSEVEVDPNIQDMMLVGVNALKNSGFSSLELSAPRSVGFAGQVSLSLNNTFATSAQYFEAFPNSLQFLGGNATTNGASLTVTAPYISIAGGGVNYNGFPNPPSPPPQSSDATLTLVATKALDLSSFIYLENIGQATFISDGDLRLLPAAYAPLIGYLLTTGNLTFEAADIYPATGTTFFIEAVPYLPTSPAPTVTFGYPDGVAPSTTTPLSAGGALVVDAGTIVQNGELQAPFGSIILGINGTTTTLTSIFGASLFFDFSPTIDPTSVTLGAGSITSVSANGATIPYGSTVDQTTWIYNPQSNNPSWNNGVQYTTYTYPLTSAPQGVVTLTGNTIDFNSGAVVNLNGGGNLYAQEWVQGTGGSRNVLLQYQTSYQNSITGQQVPTYPDARQIFAIVPGFTGVVAPYDANLSQPGLTAGEAIYLAGGNGLPAGVYTLLPAQYATLPGAYRVVANSGVVNPLYSQTTTLADGTLLMTGYLTSTLTGARPSATQQFYVQSASVWGKYSDYPLTNAASFFPAFAAANGFGTPYVPADAGRLAIAAESDLVLQGIVLGSPVQGGYGAEVDISGQYLDITDNNTGTTTIVTGATTQTYLQLSAEQLDSLGATSLLIGGLRSQTSAGMVITPTAHGIIVGNDSSTPLAAPEIMLVAAPQFVSTTITLDNDGDTATVATPVAGTGQVVFAPGSVVEARGTVGAGEPTTLYLGSMLANLPTLPSALSVSELESYNLSTPQATIENYYAAVDSALGTLVRLANSGSVNLVLPSVGDLNPGAISVTDNVNTNNPVSTVNLPSLAGFGGATIQSGATLLGGNVLTLASTGDVQVQSGAVLSGSNISLNSSQITFAGSGASPAGGALIDPVTLIQLQNATTIDLQSASTIAFQGDVAIAVGSGALTLGAGSFTSDGGQVSLDAATLTLDNEMNAPAPGATGGSGTLAINVGTLIFGTGDKSLQGFGAVSIVASQGIAGQGTGSMDFGSLPVTLQTPVIVAEASSTQTLKTTGVLSAVPISGSSGPTIPASLGGAISLQGSSVVIAVPIEAVAGNISLAASAGDVTVMNGGQLLANGVALPFYDLTEYASGGNITLSANQGTVNIQPGALVNFSGAAGGGNGGSLSIVTTGSTAPVVLGGTLLGATAAGATGSNFSLNSGGAVALDTVAQSLTTAGVTGNIAIESGAGDLALNGVLTASQVTLVANAGAVTVNGAIIANGTATAVGEIGLYGTTGVDVEGTLIASGSPNSQKPGGLINIGTSGTGSTTSLNATYGYENVDPSASGTITIGANALIDALGGTITFRAPLLDAGNAQGMNVNVVVPAAFASGSGIFGGTVNLDAYAVWSTADQSTNPNQHFDGIVDPAGWYQSAGPNGAPQLVAGTFTDQNGNTIIYTPGTYVPASGNTAAHWTPATLSNDPGATWQQIKTDLANDLANDYFTPNAYNAAHAVFYGGYNPNNESFNPSSPDAGSLPAFIQQPGFNFGTAFAGIANFQARPEVDLVNPSPANGGVNGGTITVVTNWNLGAGVMNADGSITLAYRYENTIAPVLALRAAGNVAIDASITDGFFQTAGVSLPTPASLLAQYPMTYGYAEQQYLSDVQAVGWISTSNIQYYNGFTGPLFSTFDPNSSLSPPQKGGSTLYYQNYLDYLNDWTQSWFYSPLFNQGLFIAITAPTVAAPVPPSASDPAYAADYQNYLTQYSTWLQTNFTPSTVFTAGTPTAPLTPSDPTQYASYITTDENYISYVINSFVFPALWIYAPAAPGFVVSNAPPPPPLPIPAGANSPSNMPTAANPSPIQFASLLGGQSTSYVIAAGANLASANPLAVLAGGGNVALNDHTAYTIVNSYEIVAPTTIRTGSGSIDIAASGNFELLDPIAPGVVYTAGVPLQPASASDGTTVALGNGAFEGQNGGYYNFGVSTILTPAVNAESAGNLTLTVGGDIIGIENVTDTLASTNASSPSGLTSNPGGFVGQFWEPWLLENPATPNVPWYVNFGSFDQGLMSIGGNVTIKAAGSIHDLAVSLPTTGYLDASNNLHVTGGGVLSVTAGGSIYSGDFYVGQGAGAITAGGTVAPDFNYVPADDPGNSYPVATLLAVQYATIAVEARQSVNIGGVYDPTYLWAPNMGGSSVNPPVASWYTANGTEDLIPYFTTMSPTSGVSVQTTSGSLTFNSAVAFGDMLGMGSMSLGPTGSAFVPSLLLPASLDLTALGGDIDIGYGGGLYPSATGTLSLIADQSIELGIPLLADSTGPFFTEVGNVFGTTLEKLAYPVGTGVLPTASNPNLIPVWNLPGTQTYDPALIADQASDPVHVYALNGSIVDGIQVTAADGNVMQWVILGSGFIERYPTRVAVGGIVDQISLIPNAPAEIYAGQDILDLPFYGTNFTASDVTSLIAGRDIRYSLDGDHQSPAIELAGPGTLEVIAGRNISFESQRILGVTETGIRTLGNAIDTAADPILNTAAPTVSVYPYSPLSYMSDFGNPYLPTGGASVNALFGVGPTINYSAFVANYIDPATANAFALNTIVWYNIDVLGNDVGPAMTPAQFWPEFEAMSPTQQKLEVLKAFFTVLDGTGRDYNDASSPYYHQYSNGYEAINTLFPATNGYTANSLGAVNGANQFVETGTLDLRGSTIQTQQGGNISVLGPGGRILVGSAGAAPAVNPASEGILTLESGNIDIFADQSVLVAQSRIMTEQGGNIVIWSSNGDIDAGEGAKTSVSAPPPLFACDIDFRCSADIKGQVSGAGIATLQSLPGVPVGNANLIAPRGKVNAGAAGIRVSGNLNIAALQVLNAFNIQVQGTTTGLPTYTGPSIGTLTTANNQAGAAQVAVPTPSDSNKDKPSIIIVEFIGFGGGAGEEAPQDNQDDSGKKNSDKRTEGPSDDPNVRYDTRGAVQILGAGKLSAEANGYLTTDEQRELAGASGSSSRRAP